MYMPKIGSVEAVEKAARKLAKKERQKAAKKLKKGTRSPEHVNVIFGIKYGRNSPDNAIFGIIACA